MNIRALVRFDGLAALLSGCTVLAARGWIAGWSGVPEGTLGTMAAISLGYAAYSLSLSAKRVIPAAWLKLLIAGNSGWALVCVGVVVLADKITALGTAYLLGEAMFVAVLAWLESRQLQALRHFADKAV